MTDKVDYTSEEFWKDAPEGYNAFMPESDRWYASWIDVDGDDVKRMVRRGYSFEFEVRSYAVKTLLSEGLVLRPQPKPVKPVYTQAMADNGELPPIGSKAKISRHLHNSYTDKFAGKDCEIINHVRSIRDEYDIAVFRCVDDEGEYIYHALIARCFLPIDTRTSEEKLFDQINSVPRIYIADAEKLVEQIVSGELCGVTFKGEE